MTVPSETNKSGPYHGNGVTTVFAYGFKIVDAAHLRVVLTDPDGQSNDLVLNSDYTVTGVGNDAGGNVVKSTPLLAGYDLTIVRNVPFVQETDLENQGAYYAETVEDALDLAAMRDQQLKEGLGRSLKAPVTDGGIDMTLPSKEARANRFLTFREDGRPVSTTFDVDAVQRAADTAVSSAAIAVKAADRAVNAANNAANDVRLIVKDDADRAENAANRAENAASEIGQQVENITPDVLRFSGDDVETSFDLERPGIDERLTNVYVNGIYQQKDTYSVVDGVLVFDNPPVAGTDNIEVVIGGNSSQAFAIPSNKTVGPEKLTDELRSQLAYFQTGAKIRSLAVNDVSEVGGNFPRSPVQELRATFSGGNPDGDLPNQAATDLAECLIIPPTEESTNYVFPTVPWMELEGSMRRVIPVDIRTCLINSPLNIPLFEPVKVNAWGFLTFRYIGEEPLHTILRGSIAMLVRLHGSSQDAYARHILRLRAVNPPHMEDGQNSGGRHLAGPIGAFAAPSRIQEYYEFNDPCFPITQDLLDLAAVNSWPDYYDGSQNGFFNAGDTSEALRTSDDDGPINANVRTTNWMDISSNDNLLHAYYFNITGSSSRRRVQIKTATGEIKTFYPMTSDVWGARGVYRLPADATHVRIYYSGRSDTAANMEFRRISLNASPDYDPLKGLWVQRLFNVHRDVTFWPGTEYFLDLYTETYDMGNAREWGFRFQSGGLSFSFDAGRMRKKLARKLFKGL